MAVGLPGRWRHGFAGWRPASAGCCGNRRKRPTAAMKAARRQPRRPGRFARAEIVAGNQPGVGAMEQGAGDFGGTRAQRRDESQGGRGPEVGALSRLLHRLNLDGIAGPHIAIAHPAGPGCSGWPAQGRAHGLFAARQDDPLAVLHDQTGTALFERAAHGVFRPADRHEIGEQSDRARRAAGRLGDRSSTIPVSVHTTVMRRCPSISCATSVKPVRPDAQPHVDHERTLSSRLTVTSWTASNSRPRSGGRSRPRKAEGAGTAELAVSARPTYRRPSPG